MTFKKGDLVLCDTFEWFDGDHPDKDLIWTVVQVFDDKSVLLSLSGDKDDILYASLTKHCVKYPVEIEYIPTQEGDKEDDI